MALYPSYPSSIPCCVILSEPRPFVPFQAGPAGAILASEKPADTNTLEVSDKDEEKRGLLNNAKKVTKTQREMVKEAVEKVAMDMGKEFIAWMLEKPIVLDPRQHPKWPGYTGIGTKLNFRLETQVYESRCLVENTIASFYPTEGNRNLTPAQLIAKEKIISLFKNLKEDKERRFGTKELNQFMKLLDEFFFFGSMANKGRPRVLLRVWFKGDKYAKHFAAPLFESPAAWGLTRDRHVRGYGAVSEIHMAGATLHVDPVPLWFMIKTLVHEMVHCYINLYMCRCPTCHRDSLNTYGIAGHGKTFLMLLDCMDQTLRSWDVGLTAAWNETVSVYCVAGAACPQAEKHDERGHLQFPLDEIWNLSQREKQLVETRTSPITPASEKRAPVETTETKQEKQEDGWMEFNDLRPVDKMEPGMRVFMTGPLAGATMVSWVLLDRTGDTVQKLIAETPAKSSEKLLTKFNLSWLKIGNKDEPQQKQG